jgi:phosphomannomutase
MNVKVPLRISQVGLRGVVGVGLTPAHVLDFSAAFATLLGEPSKVIIGRDPRASGQMIREGVVAALLACGHDVVDLGIVSTPVIQHAIAATDARGGISIGASHMAAEWNALKFFGEQGSYLSTAEAGELLDIYHLKKFDFAQWDKLGSYTRDDGAIDRYIDNLAEVFDFAALTQFRVLVDCCNGTSGLVLGRLRDRFGLNLVLINEQTEGRAFAHEPATDQRTVRMQLAPLMRHVGADAGFLFDVDSDRVALATESGEAVSEELVLVLLADEMLALGPGDTVIANLSSTALLDEIAASHNGRVVRVAVGRNATADALAGFRPEQVAIAGEGTGAVMMPQFRFVYDGIASMLAILTMMARRGQSLGTILSAYPKYSILKGEVPLESHRIPQMMDDIENRYPEAKKNNMDGLRADFDGSWFHVRVSQTAPLVRVIAEQRGEAPKALFEELMDTVRSYNS